MLRQEKLSESGCRVDVFSDAKVLNEGIRLYRSIRDKEREEERILTVREGKPVALFFNERNVQSPLLRLTYIGRVEETEFVRDSQVSVLVSSPNLPGRLQNELFKLYIEECPDLTSEVIALETNVDLTQLELKAIDAFQRSTQLAKGARERASQLEEEALYDLFGSPPSW